LNHGVVSSLYNPFAAVPSMHFGYAIVVGVALVRYGGHVVLRALGALYPALVLLVIVATGNHFLFGAAAGAARAAIAAGVRAAVPPPVSRRRAEARPRHACPRRARCRRQSGRRAPRYDRQGRGCRSPPSRRRRRCRRRRLRSPRRPPRSVGTSSP